MQIAGEIPSDFCYTLLLLQFPFASYKFYGIISPAANFTFNVVLAGIPPSGIKSELRDCLTGKDIYPHLFCMLIRSCVSLALFCNCNFGSDAIPAIVVLVRNDDKNIIDMGACIENKGVALRKVYIIIL